MRPGNLSTPFSLFLRKNFQKIFEKRVDKYRPGCYNTDTVEDTPEREERLDRLTRKLDTS